MWQTGHIMLDTPNWDMITSNYNRIPAKPVLDGEPNYEGNPIDPFLRKWKPEYGRFTDYVMTRANKPIALYLPGHVDIHMGIIQFGSFGHFNVNLSYLPWLHGRMPFWFPEPFKWFI
jgi:hypothetical protein